MLSGYPVIDRAISSTAAHLNILGTFRDILNPISGGKGGSLLGVWENHEYETFTTTDGVNITSLINSSGTGVAYMILNDDIISGETIIVKITTVKSSGTLPLLYLINPLNETQYDSQQIVEGTLEYELTSSWSGGMVLAVANEITNVNCSLTGISVYRKPRTFAFHRGSCNVKMRQWNLELIEIKE